MLLEGGCLCCKVRGDLVRTAGELLARRARGEAEFDRIVVETTGLADPAPILQALMTDREIADALRLESVIATVDCAAGGATLDAHPESVKQAALADRIVLTKTDLADPAPSQAAAQAQSAAPQLTALHGAVDARLLFTSSAYEPRFYESHAHSDNVTSFCLRRTEPLHAVTLSLFLQLLAEHCGGKLCAAERPGRCGRVSWTPCGDPRRSTCSIRPHGSTPGPTATAALASSSSPRARRRLAAGLARNPGR